MILTLPICWINLLQLSSFNARNTKDIILGTKKKQESVFKSNKSVVKNFGCKSQKLKIISSGPPIKA